MENSQTYELVYEEFVPTAQCHAELQIECEGYAEIISDAEEIESLRRIVAQVAEPEMQLYTMS